MMKASIDLVNDTIKVALLDNSHSFDPTNTQFSDVSANEVSGTAYVAGGETLTGNAVSQDDTDDEGVFDADDTIWSSSTITAFHAVIYDDTTGTKFLIATIDFGQAFTSTNGDFTIQWDTEGIININ